MVKGTAWFVYTAIPVSPGFLFCCYLLYVTSNTCLAETNHTSTEETSPKDRTPTPQTYIFTYPDTYEPVKTSADKYRHQLTIATPVSDDVNVTVVTYTPSGSTDKKLGSYVIHHNTSVSVSVTSANSTEINSTLLTVKITSSDAINVYAFDYFSKNVDGELIRPVDTLGKEHVVLTLPYNAVTILAKAFFVATVVEDNTTVTVSKQSEGQLVNLSSLVSSGSLQLSASGHRLTATLHEGQTVSVTYRGDLTGLRVTSDKPLGLSSGVNRNRIKGHCCQDHLWTHLPGVGSWDKEYITYPTNAVTGKNGNNRDDIFYLVGAERNTTIYLDCNSTIFLPEPLTWYYSTLDSFTGYHIFSAKTPFAVVKAVQGHKNIIDPCMVALTPTSQWSTTLTFPLPNTRLWERLEYKFTVTLLMEKPQTEHLRVNGEAPSITWIEMMVSGRDTNGSTSVVIMGGELSDKAVARLGKKRQPLVFSSVTGTSRMAAYVTGIASHRGLCFALGGDAPMNENWAPGGVLMQCNDIGIPVPEITTTQTITSPTTTTITITATMSAAIHATDTIISTTAPPDSLEGVLTTEASTSEADTQTTTVKERIQMKSSGIVEDTTTLTTNAESIMTSTSISEITSSTDFSSHEDFTALESTNAFTSTDENTYVTNMNTGTTISTSSTIALASAASESSTFVDSTTTTQASPRIPPCFCIRKCSPLKHDNGLVAAKVDRIKKELLLPTRNLSSYLRKQTCASDHRMSSATIGAVSVLVICFVVVFFVGFDVVKLIGWLCWKDAGRKASRS